MSRRGIAFIMLLAAAPCVAQGQSLSITAGSATGDCGGTSFSQAADASGKFLSAEWAGAGQFPIAINRGRVRCTIRFTVTMQTGYKLVPGGGNGNPMRLAIAQLAPLRLNGATSGALIESTVAIDNGTPTTGGSMANGGTMTFAALTVDRAATSASLESACSTTAKSTFQVNAVVDLAAASNYVVPWPPEPYAERETASISTYRLYYNVVPCATRSVNPTRGN
ncbi:MAG: hypothetical protein H7099_16955 [Gemmatimonadaceae bacterium]|nr:hypothetical protein [Gemmatimonadaceae bacterium]